MNTWHERANWRLKAIGMSQGSLARTLNIKQPRLSMWLSGQREPTIAYFAAIVRAIGVSADWLLTSQSISTNIDLDEVFLRSTGVQERQTWR